MTNFLVIAVFVLIASGSVYGVSVAPAAVAFDGYDHSFEAANAARVDGDAEAGH